MSACLRLLNPFRAAVLLALAGAVAGCPPAQNSAETATAPPVSHYEGNLALAGQPEVRAALDIRHPSPGHYEAELTVPTAPTLSFVADTVFFRNNRLRLTRPARPGQTLALTLDGDFWRGTLALDSARVPAILVRRGAPAPRTYRTEAVAQATGPAWLFAPADISTAGPALVVLPDATAAPAAALWADALAREGIIVLVLPATDSASAADEAPRLETALRRLRRTAGADTANLGVWAVGQRAGAVAQALAAAGGPRAAFVIAQNPTLDLPGKTAFRELRSRKLPLLGLCGGANAAAQAKTLRNALGSGRRGSAMRVYGTAGPNLLVPGGLSPRFAPGLPAEVVQWLRDK